MLCEYYIHIFMTLAGCQFRQQHFVVASTAKNVVATILEKEYYKGVPKMASASSLGSAEWYNTYYSIPYTSYIAAPKGGTWSDARALSESFRLQH